jgi:hypothetical protein
MITHNEKKQKSIWFLHSLEWVSGKGTYRECGESLLLAIPKMPHTLGKTNGGWKRRNENRSLFVVSFMVYFYLSEVPGSIPGPTSFSEK